MKGKRLARECIAEIIAAAKAGMTTYAIADAFELPQSTVAHHVVGLNPRRGPRQDTARLRRIIAAVRAYDEGRADDLPAIAERFGFSGPDALREAARNASRRLSEDHSRQAA